jgi:hypothetical protein
MTDMSKQVGLGGRPVVMLYQHFSISQTACCGLLSSAVCICWVDSSVHLIPVVTDTSSDFGVHNFLVIARNVVLTTVADHWSIMIIFQSDYR